MRCPVFRGTGYNWLLDILRWDVMIFCFFIFLFTLIKFKLESYRLCYTTDIQFNKKVQQSWQTSALAMHLPLARLVSMPVIFYLLPSSSIVILVLYLFSTGISEQHIWELWIQSTGLTLPLFVTPMNNPITLISPVQWGLHFFAADFLCVALQISEQFYPKARTPAHWMTSSDQILWQNDHTIQGHSRSSVSVSMKSH